MAQARVKNPRKRFLWSITFVKRPINPYLFQRVTIPDVTIDETAHGDTNRNVKTGGRVMVGSMTAEKLETTAGSDTWFWNWLMSVQDLQLGGGLTPSQYWETVLITELAEDGVSVINQWIAEEVWPMKVDSQEQDRMSSENTIERIEFSVGRLEKL